MSNASDTKYAEYLLRLSARYAKNTAGVPVFSTSLSASTVWARYLHSFNQTQYHNCFTCHSFINRYAGLVVVDPATGRTSSAMWDDGDVDHDDREMLKAVRILRAYAEDAPINGVLLSEADNFGLKMTGGWIHLYLENPTKWDGAGIFGSRKTSTEAMVEKREQFKYVKRALHDFSTDVLEKALNIIESKAAYRAERYNEMVRWLLELKSRTDNVPGVRRDNLVWLAVAVAPAGFTHIRSSAVGTMLKDIAAGLPIESVKARFEDKMDPTKFQQSQKAPSATQVELAERAVTEMGIAPAFSRRYLRSNDIDLDGVVWEGNRATPPASKEPQPEKTRNGLFDGLAPAKADKPVTDTGLLARPITWEKFERDVLPAAAYIEYVVPRVGRFAALTTATDNDAPPIIQWDTPDWRNPVSWSFANPAPRAEEWNLQPGDMVRVRTIVRTPNLWRGNPAAKTHGEGVFLLLDGAKDTRDLPGGGLFIEHLKNELKPYRAVIQAHVARTKTEGADDPDVNAFGIGLLAGNDWTEVAAPPPPSKISTPAGTTTAKSPDHVHVVLVLDDSGSMASYISAARAALRSLLESVRTMPGKVDVTIYTFGTTVNNPVFNRVGVERLFEHPAQIEGMLRGASGYTALNDAIGRAIEDSQDFPRRSHDTTYFLGIVTDGEENRSRVFTQLQLNSLVRRVLATGNWTIAFAGAGRDPESYARAIGIPPGNIMTFSADNEGFGRMGQEYAVATSNLAAGYAAGVRATNTFFTAASGNKAIGKDLPTLVVHTRTGGKMAYKLDRWE